MSLSDSEDDKTTTRRRRVNLTGSDNYKEWERSILSWLIQKDLDEVVEEGAAVPETYAEQKSWIRKDRKAWAAIDESLSASVHNVLPAYLFSIHFSAPTGTSNYSHDHHRAVCPDAACTPTRYLLGCPFNLQG